MEGFLWVAAAVLLGPAILMFAVGLFNLALGIVMVPVRFATRVAVRSLASPRGEREAALSRGANGSAMLAAAAGVIYWLGMDGLAANLSLPAVNPMFWLAAAVPVLAIWGTAWVLTGCGWRSRGIRDGRLIFRFLLRLALGVAALVWTPPYPNLEMPLRLLAAYLLLTAAVKLVLVLVGGGNAERRINKLLKQRNAPLVAAKSRRFLFW